jgi:hypothetical protein
MGASAVSTIGAAIALIPAACGCQLKFRGEFACRPGIAASYRDDTMQSSGLAATALH